jgi:4-amino-4-deoxy-L-arabinose transferase-like glycosyltransferase
MSEPLFRRIWSKVFKPHMGWLKPAYARIQLQMLFRQAWAGVSKPRLGLTGLSRVRKAWRSVRGRTWVKAPKPSLVLNKVACVWASWRASFSSLRLRIRPCRRRPAWLTRLWVATRTHVRDPEHRLVWGIILLAGVLRLGYLDLIQFGSEQTRHLLGGLELVQNLKLPLIGLRTSTGIAQPPLMSYLLALPLLLGRDPRIAAAFLALLNVAAVTGFYFLARRCWGIRVAAVAAVLFAANPWAVVISRRVCAASVLAPLATLELWALCAALVDGKPWGWAVAWLGLGLMIGVTFSALVIAVVLIFLMAVYYRRIHWGHILLGIGLTLIVLLPYLYYQNAHRLEDILALVHQLRRSAEPASLFRVFRYAVRMHSGQHLSTLAGASGEQFLPHRSILGWLDKLSAWTFLIALLWLGVAALGAWSHWKNRRDPVGFVILIAWLWWPLLLWTFYSAPMELDDLALLHPAGFLAMGLLLDRVVDWSKSRPHPLEWLVWLQIPVWLILVALMAWQAYSVVYLYDFAAHHDTRGSYGTPYRFWRHVANLTRRSAKAMGTNQIWVITQGTDPAQDEYPMLLSYLLGPQVHPVFLGQGGTECMLLPAGRPGVYLLTRPSPPVEKMLHHLRAEEKGVVFFPENKLEVRVWGLPKRDVEDMLNLVSHRGLWGWDSGLWLVGYDLPATIKPGEILTFVGSWTFQDVPSQEHLMRHALFNYLVGTDGAFAAIRADLGLPERYWAGGLLLLQWVDLKLPETMPAGDYTLFIGMDRLSDSYRHRLMDGQGHILGESLSLGPVRVSK